MRPRRTAIQRPRTRNFDAHCWLLSSDSSPIRRAGLILITLGILVFFTGLTNISFTSVRSLVHQQPLLFYVVVEVPCELQLAVGRCGPAFQLLIPAWNCFTSLVLCR